MAQTRLESGGGSKHARATRRWCTQRTNRLARGWHYGQMAVAVHDHDGGLSDAALVERVRRGERDSFVVLLVRHRPVVRAVCRRLLGRSSLVEDVMQESAVEALVGIGSLRDPD